MSDTYTTVTWTNDWFLTNFDLSNRLSLYYYNNLVPARVIDFRRDVLIMANGPDGVNVSFLDSLEPARPTLDQIIALDPALVSGHVMFLHQLNDLAATPLTTQRTLFISHCERLKLECLVKNTVYVQPTMAESKAWLVQKLAEYAAFM